MRKEGQQKEILNKKQEKHCQTRERKISFRCRQCNRLDPGVSQQIPPPVIKQQDNRFFCLVQNVKRKRFQMDQLVQQLGIGLGIVRQIAGTVFLPPQKKQRPLTKSGGVRPGKPVRVPFGALMQTVIQLQILSQIGGVDAGELFAEAIEKIISLFQRLAFILSPFADKTVPEGLIE